MLKALPLALVLPAFALGGCALLQGKQAPLDKTKVLLIKDRAYKILINN